MQPERWGQIDELFHAALKVEPGQRASFLAQACGDDEPLRSEVESLISSHEQARSFIETPAADLAAGLLSEGQANLVTGQTVGPYKIVELLGRGGMGEVYLAEDSRLGRKIALKLLPRQFTLDDERIRRFEREARAASALNHPNIVTIHEIGQLNSTRFIVTEFVDGETLRQRMNEKPLTLNEALNVAIQTAEALSAAHTAGIVHRDIKPENIMLRNDGYVKILDFGLAKLTERLASDTELETSTLLQSNPGLVMGTVQYMSPEQARGQIIDGRSDIWSLGIVLYELLSGRVPFSGETPSHVMVSVMENELPPLSDIDVPPELDRIATKALQKEKRERYQTAADLMHDLKNLMQELEVEKLKSSLDPEKFDKQTANKTDMQKPVSSAAIRAAQTRDMEVAHPLSSAEYMIKQIKRHKAGALFALTLITALGLIAGYLYFANRNRSAENAEAIDSVAVLPFITVDNEPNKEYLAEGISDSIINNLTQLRSLKVMSLNSVLRYKGKQTDAQVVGRDLKVGAVLMGRLAQRGDDLSITAELVDVRDNRRLWGGQYNRKLSDILVTQNEIAREIAERLRLRLTGEERNQLAKRYTDNVKAYELYTLGMYHVRRLTPEDGKKAIEYFEEAIRIDPKYALAYAGLSRVYFGQGQRGLALPKDARQRMEGAAFKAVEIDDRLADAHAQLGLVKKSNCDWTGAEQEFKRALELDPKSVDGLFLYSIYLAHIGQTNEALEFAKRYEEVAGGPIPMQGFVYLYAHEYDKAIERYLNSRDRVPSSSQVAECYLGKKMYQEAIVEMQKVVDRIKAPEQWTGYPVLAYAYAQAGRRAEALKILKDQNLHARRGYISPFNFAIIYTGLGDKDRAFEYLNKAYDEGSQVLPHFPRRPLFDSLHTDPRYLELLRKMNYPLR